MFSIETTLLKCRLVYFYGNMLHNKKIYTKRSYIAKKSVYCYYRPNKQNEPSIAIIFLLFSFILFYFINFL